MLQNVSLERYQNLNIYAEWGTEFALRWMAALKVRSLKFITERSVKKGNFLKITRYCSDPVPGFFQINIDFPFIGIRDCMLTWLESDLKSLEIIFIKQ